MVLAAAVSLLAASGAGAATFCVGKPATCPGTNVATMQDAVVASNGNGDGEQDRIEVGSGTFQGPTTGTATPVDVVGEGTGATTINGVPGATTTLSVGGTGVSSVSALQIIPDGNDSPALRLLSSSPSQPSSAFNLLVTGSAAPAGAVGVQLLSAATLSDSSVNMTVGAPSTAVTTQGGSVERTHLEGRHGADRHRHAPAAFDRRVNRRRTHRRYRRKPDARPGHDFHAGSRNGPFDLLSASAERPCRRFSLST